MKPPPPFLPPLLTIFLAAGAVAPAAEHEADVVIYGGTSAGIIAAVQAVEMGRSAIVVGPDVHLGGLTAGGLGWTDSGNKEVIGGLSQTFYQQVRDYYDQPETWRWEQPSDYPRYREGEEEQWTFEPHVAEKVFEDLVREHGLTVHRDAWLDREPGEGVTKEGERITAIKMLSGDVYRAKMFIDATYEGDLMAAAGVSYTVGREANSQYGETLNGVQVENADKHQFSNPVDPYVVPGDPSSGLVPRIHGNHPGQQGEADDRIQAYNYRVCLTRVPENRVPFPKPEGYDPFQYELLLRDLKAGSGHIRGKFDMLPNLKTDTNNHGSFSTDNIGMNYDYPEATYERRREILDEHERYQKGYFHFIANDPRVPENQRQWMAAWGLAKDEFTDNGHWPHQIYVREARRLLGDFVVTENHVRRSAETPRPVGMGSYNMDSHNVQRYVDEEGHARNEGDIQVSPGGPYPIDYGAIVPQKGEAENLLVPVCVSATHIAFGSIRMEPVFMILGQSAATAASIAIDRGLAVQDVPYDALATKLLADGQVLEYTGGGGAGAGTPAAELDGVVVDDSQLGDKEGWTASRSVGPFVGAGYLHDNDGRKGALDARFETTPPESGRYEVRVSYTPHQNRATNVPVSIEHAGGESTTTLNQQARPAGGGFFHPLGTFRFEKGKPAAVTISNKDTNGHVIVDAVQFLPATEAGREGE